MPLIAGFSDPRLGDLVFRRLGLRGNSRQPMGIELLVIAVAWLLANFAVGALAVVRAR
jgi:hypothetical protein